MGPEGPLFSLGVLLFSDLAPYEVVFMDGIPIYK